MSTLSWATERDGLRFTGIKYDANVEYKKTVRKNHPVSSANGQTGFGWATERKRANYGTQFRTAYEKDAQGRRVARGLESDQVHLQAAADVDAAAEARRKRRQAEVEAASQTESFREQSWGKSRERPAYAQPMASVVPTQPKPLSTQPAPQPAPQAAPQPAPQAPAAAAQPAAAQPAAAQPAAAQPAQRPASADPWVEKRARELAQDAVEAYFSDLIDEAELKRRKQAAHQTATEELGVFALLEEANAAYASASLAREAAEQALKAAVEAEDDAANKVEEVLRAIEEKGVSPPSAGN